RDLADDLHFNTAISSLMELVNDCSNALRASDGPGSAGGGNDAGAAGSISDAMTLAFGEALYHLVLMLSPMAPHLCEELWEKMGHSAGIRAGRSPQPDRRALAADTVTLVVQVNGKVRARLEVPAGAADGEVERQALALPAVTQNLGGRAPRKVVVV